MKDKLLKEFLSALEGGSEMAPIVAQLIEAPSNDYEVVISALIESRNVLALKAFMRHFPPIETLKRKGVSICSPFEILVCDVKEITEAYKDLLREIVVYLDLHRQDLFTYSSKKNILKEIWCVAVDLECMDHFYMVASQYTYPHDLVEGLYNDHMSYRTLDSNYIGKTVRLSSNCTETRKKCIHESRKIVSYLGRCAGNLSVFNWYRRCCINQFQHAERPLIR